MINRAEKINAKNIEKLWNHQIWRFLWNYFVGNLRFLRSCFILPQNTEIRAKKAAYRVKKLILLLQFAEYLG